MDVPGHDGRYGFGGACLPKDSKAFYEYSKSVNEPLNLLNEVILSNNLIRSQYNSNNKREADQNINYDNKNQISPSGGIGRHKGLKILDRNIVPVQVRPRVPLNNNWLSVS